MPPPPATPTPSRFLLSKRQARSSQTGAPLARTPVAATGATSSQLPGGTQQFHSTPRFAVSSTPRQAPLSTPLPAFSTLAAASAGRGRARASQGQYVNAIIDDSSPPSSGRSPPTQTPQVGDLSDAIEVDSPSPSPTARYSSPFPPQEEEESIVQRSPKRRRISVSSDVDDAESELDLLEEGGPLTGEARSDSDAIWLASGDSGSEGNKEDEASSSDLRSDDDDAMEQDNNYSGSDLDMDQQLPKQRGHHRPTFQRPPRFKASELHEESQGLQLSDIFSPQRRGTKYVPGGLAAELRDWLVQIRGHHEPGEEGSGEGAPEGCLVVEEIRTAGPGMRLVRGYPVQQGQPATDARRVNVILAGDGRLNDLAKSNTVASGCVIGIAQPAWEIALEGQGSWTVACDWSAL